MKKIVLASASPRRIELLKMFLPDITIIPSNYEEKLIDTEPIRLSVELAKGKAIDVASRVDGKSIIIGADTIVVMNSLVFGKPKDKEDAKQMLYTLSGKVHQVITGLCVLDVFNNKTITSYESTDVYFKELSADEIDLYIKSGEPFDKAGAYAIQGLASIFVKKINGCYFNVVGLPVYKLNEMLKDVGVNLLSKECLNGSQEK
ncbi:Septum formation protein Maf [Caloramator mitchellensis]|uniref:dTTP/UTP pyrophosphatase n=1 Tax=Caloramator mitchellensis TaxID=908809 RepID=A0A0R3JX70_CALMK|nr:Maf family protein [Caloramator mitchellensis]KRQ88139.1 Septum formation protein Maf [Caloramator mitchellensis]